MCVLCYGKPFGFSAGLLTRRNFVAGAAVIVPKIILQRSNVPQKIIRFGVSRQVDHITMFRPP